MKWLLAAGGIVTTTTLMVIVGGAMLPRDHVVALAARIDAVPAAVWRVVVEPDRFADSRDERIGFDLLPSVRAETRREPRRRGPITVIMNGAQPGQRLVERVMDEDVPAGTSWECVIDADGPSRSRITITERGEIANPAVRFLLRFLIGPAASIDDYLRALGEQFGSEPIPEAVFVPSEPKGS
ncbi:MAG TPA: hypothetical protein VHV78_15095 [Gemmatimonadaceae bacterium]|nr:hypothetical protein [Gemmatimonadaceae bacterium]